jgi:hypothetical protein
MFRNRTLRGISGNGTAGSQSATDLLAYIMEPERVSDGYNNILRTYYYLLVLPSTVSPVLGHAVLVWHIVIISPQQQPFEHYSRRDWK